MPCGVNIHLYCGVAIYMYISGVCIMHFWWCQYVYCEAGCVVGICATMYFYSKGTSYPISSYNTHVALLLCLIADTV